MKQGIEDRIYGTMFGVAVGDALGAPLEFMSEDAIRVRHGFVREMIGGGWLNVAPGEVTDDTQMSLAVAGGILENPDSPVEAIGARFVAWYNSSPKDIGGTCAAAISAAVGAAKDKRRPTQKDWRSASLSAHERLGGRSAGNGSLMRTAYCGIYYKALGEIVAHADEISRMTHYDRVASADCGAYCCAIHRLLKEEDPEKRKRLIPETIAEFNGCAARYPYELLSCRGYKPNPTGYVVDSLATALHCIYTTDTFADAVTKAVNLGGDADTIGAITGGLAGALYGASAIPERWHSALSKNDTSIIDALCEAATDARKED